MRSKKAPIRPAVEFPTATQFNDMVAVDVRPLGTDGYIMHMIDHLTRYSSACLIKDKNKETIVSGLLKFWIRIFGFPKTFLTINSGKMRNVIDHAEKFNITLKTTAAESNWSNSMCERHNRVLKKSINRILQNCVSLDYAIHWAVAVKKYPAVCIQFQSKYFSIWKKSKFPDFFWTSFQ